MFEHIQKREHELNHVQMLIKKEILCSKERALAQAKGIYDTILKIFSISKTEHVTTFEASNRLAEERIKAISSLKTIYVGKSQFVGRLGENDFGKR